MENNTSHITIRPATADDIALIVRVLVMAMGEDAAPTYCGEKYLDVLGEIVATQGTQYHYSNAWVAELDGRPAAALVAYDGAELPRLRANTLAVVHRYRPLEINFDETRAGEYYLDSIAVLPEFRGQGLAPALIGHLKSQLKVQGYPILGLIVDVDNPTAERLYTSLGFRALNYMDFFGHRMKHMQCPL